MELTVAKGGPPFLPHFSGYLEVDLAFFFKNTSLRYRKDYTVPICARGHEQEPFEQTPFIPSTSHLCGATIMTISALDGTLALLAKPSIKAPPQPYPSPLPTHPPSTEQCQNGSCCILCLGKPLPYSEATLMEQGLFSDLRGSTWSQIAAPFDQAQEGD